MHIKQKLSNYRFSVDKRNKNIPHTVSIKLSIFDARIRNTIQRFIDEREIQLRMFYVLLNK